MSGSRAVWFPSPSPLPRGFFPPMENSVMKKLTLGLTVAALALTGTAYAAPGSAPRDGEARRNAVMTRADVEQRAAQRFQRLDFNHDGKIDQTDRAGRRDQMLTAQFDRLDADHNGALSRGEFAARPAMQQGRDGQEARGGPGMRRFGMRGPGQRMGRGMGRMADSDRNGVVTQAEFTANAVQRFERMDGDRDGQVTPEERRSARAQMREHRQERAGRRDAPPPAN